MTAHALGVLLDSRRHRMCAEVDHAGERTTAGLDVSTPRPVAGFALQTAVAKRAVRVIRSRVLGSKDADHTGIVVTTQTRVGAARTEL
jgi:hypothetical protein